MTSQAGCDKMFFMDAARTMIFHIADPKGRPSIRSTDQDYARFMVKQGWTVTDIDVVVGTKA